MSPFLPENFTGIYIQGLHNFSDVRISSLERATVNELQGFRPALEGVQIRSRAMGSSGYFFAPRNSLPQGPHFVWFDDLDKGVVWSFLITEQIETYNSDESRLEIEGSENDSGAASSVEEVAEESTLVVQLMKCLNGPLDNPPVGSIAFGVDFLGKIMIDTIAKTTTTGTPEMDDGDFERLRRAILRCQSTGYDYVPGDFVDGMVRLSFE